jgi:DNA polymerase I
MNVRCPNCEEYVELPDSMDPGFEEPLCNECGAQIPGYSSQYRICARCHGTFLRFYDTCISCAYPAGTRAEIMTTWVSSKNSMFHSPGWHAYSIDRQNRTVVFEYRLLSDNRAVGKVLSELAAASILAIDTETSGLDPYTCELILLQIATPQCVYIFDVRNLDKKSIGSSLKPILENPKTLTILHNANFDYKFIKVHLGISLVNIYDTLLANSLLTAGTHIPGALQALARLYFDVDMDKGIRLSFLALESLEAAHLEYAARDVAILFPLYYAQYRQLDAEGLTPIAKIEFDAIQPLAEMELAGVMINVEKWKDIIAKHKTERDRLQVEVQALLAPPQRNRHLYGESDSILLITSQKQVITAFAALGVKLEDTKEETLAKLDHPAAKKLLEFREHDKIVIAFGESFLELLNPVTNRIHPDFKQYGAETGRLSCQHPNVQQIPAFFRECFIAPPGWKVVTCDYSQAELRILAQLSHDPGFCDAFNSGGDLHSITASKMFKVDLKDVSKTQRSQAKAINFGLAYGMGAAALADRIGVEKGEAEKLIEQYFKAYPKVANWLIYAAHDANRYGYSKTPLGRKRYFQLPLPSDPEYKTKVSSIERQGKNTPIQGANADMTKIALRFIFDKLQNYTARIVNTVHDEIVVEVIAEQADEVTRIVADEMRRAGRVFIRDVPIEVGVVTADTWSK